MASFKFLDSFGKAALGGNFGRRPYVEPPDIDTTKPLNLSADLQFDYKARL